MALPVHVQTVSASSTSSATVSVSITATVGNLLVIQVTGKNGNATLTSVTVGGNAATKIADATANFEQPRAEGWYYYVTSGSSVSVVATMGGSPNSLQIGVTELSSPASSSPVNAVATRVYANTDAPSASITTTVADCLLFCIISHKATSITEGAGQTQRWEVANQGGGSTKSAATAGAYTMSGTVGFNWTAMIVFAIKGASGSSYTETIGMSASAALSESAALAAQNTVSVAASATLADSSRLAATATISMGVGASMSNPANVAMAAVVALASAAQLATSGGTAYTDQITMAAAAAMPANAVLNAFVQIPLAASAQLNPAAILAALNQVSLAAGAQLSPVAQLAINLSLGMSANAAMATAGDVNTTSNNYTETIGMAAVANLNSLAQAAFFGMAQLGASAALTAQAQAAMVNSIALAIAAQLVTTAAEVGGDIGNYLVSLATVVQRVYEATETARIYRALEVAHIYEARFIG